MIAGRAMCEPPSAEPPAPPFAFEEFESLAIALAQRVREGSLTPDDAFWWTVALCDEAYMRETHGGRYTAPDPNWPPPCA